MSNEEQAALIKDFSVLETMKEVEDSYIEEHDRVMNAIHERIENLQGDVE